MSYFNEAHEEDELARIDSRPQILKTDAQQNTHKQIRSYGFFSRLDCIIHLFYFKDLDRLSLQFRSSMKERNIDVPHCELWQHYVSSLVHHTFYPISIPESHSKLVRAFFQLRYFQGVLELELKLQL